MPKNSFLIGLLLAGTAVVLSGCQRADSANSGKPPAGASRAVPVAVAPAVKRDLPVYLTGLGSVSAFNTVSVKSRVDGQLVRVDFKEGQQVSEGQLLAQIDARPFEVQLSQAQAQLFRDQAQLKDAQLNYQRFKDLLEKSGAVSQQQVDTQRALADQLEGSVRGDQAAIDNAKLQITYSRITAPISGRVGLRMVDAGNIVHANDQNAMLVITQLQPIAVLFTLPEDSLPAVARGMKQSTLAVEAYSRDDQNKLATGKLTTIDNQIDATTGTGKLKAVFDNRDGALWPNQFVNVRLLLDVRKDSIIIPSVAVQRGPQGDFVYVIKPDKTAEVRPVTVALTQASQSVIANGLQAGDSVVTDGQDKLQNGAKVDPAGPNQNAGPRGTRPAPAS